MENCVRLWIYDMIREAEAKGEAEDNTQLSLLLAARQIAEGQEDPTMKFVGLCQPVMGECAQGPSRNCLVPTTSFRVRCIRLCITSWRFFLPICASATLRFVS